MSEKKPKKIRLTGPMSLRVKLHPDEALVEGARNHPDGVRIQTREDFCAFLADRALDGILPLRDKGAEVLAREERRQMEIRLQEHEAKARELREKLAKEDTP